jgi:CO/xanthine dehydrogenase Mo-binding subunit
LGSWRFVGQSLPRTEDRRLLTGLGRYTSDLAAPDACRLVVLRSPHAAARIRTGQHARLHAIAFGSLRHSLLTHGGIPEKGQNGEQQQEDCTRKQDRCAFHGPRREAADREGEVHAAVHSL